MLLIITFRKPAKERGGRIKYRLFYFNTWQRGTVLYTVLIESYHVREHLTKKNVFFWALPKLPLPPSPQFGQVVQLFLDVKNEVFARITEPSNDDYDNDVSDDCDNNFGTFDDFGVKND